MSWHYRFDAVWSTLPLSWGMSCKRKHYTKRTRVIYISTSCKRELAATHEFSSRQMPDFFLAFTTTMQPPLWPIVYITKIAKLGNLLKLDIRKLSVLLHNRWRREVPSTGLTHKIRIFLEITLCMGAFCDVSISYTLYKRLNFYQHKSMRTLHENFPASFFTLS